MKRCLLLYLLLISSWVQASRVIFDRITTEDGLASSRVTSVVATAPVPREAATDAFVDSDPNYFTRCFKEVYGVTPSEFMSM